MTANAPTTVSEMCVTYKAMLDRKDSIEGLEAVIDRVHNSHGNFWLWEGETTRLEEYAKRLGVKKFGKLPNIVASKKK